MSNQNSPKKRIVKAWTKEEDDIIRSSVSDYPHNLAAAFECAASVLGNRTLKAVSGRWYAVLRVNKIAVMAIGSRNSQIQQNVKNTPRINTSSKEGIDLSDVMRDVINLPKKDIDVLRRYLNAMQKD